jgi:hypothetical protein
VTAAFAALSNEDGFALSAKIEADGKAMLATVGRCKLNG